MLHLLQGAGGIFSCHQENPCSVGVQRKDAKSISCVRESIKVTGKRLLPS